MAISTYSQNAIEYCETQVGVLTGINTTNYDSIAGITTTRDNFQYPAEKIEDTIKVTVASINSKKAQILQIAQTANDLGCGTGSTTAYNYTDGRYRVFEDELATFKFNDLGSYNDDNIYDNTSIALNDTSGIGVTTYLFTGPFASSGLETGTTFGSSYAYSRTTETSLGGIGHSAITNLGYYYGDDIGSFIGITNITGLAAIGTGTTVVIYDTFGSTNGSSGYCSQCLSSITTLVNEIIVLRQGLLQNPNKLEGISKIKSIKTDSEIGIHAIYRNIAENVIEQSRLNSAKEVMQLDQYDGTI